MTNLSSTKATRGPSSGAAPHADAARVGGLEGLRGLAAVYVVVFHCWLLNFPGFPANTGPAALGWLMYGRLAVVFFLALSGFSLALSPAASGWRLGGLTRYARRRAWRILPPYWAALALSLVVAALVVPASHFGPPTRDTVIVYGLMLQDVAVAPTPNGSFWSIAVEVELYAIFPLLLFLRRRLGVVAVAAIAVVPVAALATTVPHGTPVEGVNLLAPNLAPVFVAGMIAAGAVSGRGRDRRMPWSWLSLLAAVPVLAVIVMRGSVWTVNHYFWIDLAVSPSMVLFIVAVALGRPAIVRRLLDSRPLRALGAMSFSLYLINMPMIMVISRKVAKPYVGSGLPAFLVTLLIGVPLSLLCAWLFAKAFEQPFLRYRSWRDLLAGLRALVAACSHGLSGAGRLGR
ncbi:acyltransferase family protein [Krasilnikovia sp. MM14-A1259]|uniref:acyltransferase family protein n=1 Tax=Krasilnikovia sp. MM14-A1259 TaxID=3373539 RepID=UPI0038080D80